MDPTSVQALLENDEALLWSNVSGGRLYRMSPVFSVWLSGVGFLMALYSGIFVCVGLATGEKLSGVFPLLFGFFLFGSWMAVSPWVGHLVTRVAIVCAITDKRALVIRRQRGKRDVIESRSVAELNQLIAREYEDGSGTVWLVCTSWPGGSHWWGLPDVPDIRGACAAVASIVPIAPVIRSGFSMRIRSIAKTAMGKFGDD